MNFEKLCQNWQNQDTQSTQTPSNDIIKKAQLQTQKLKHKKWWTIGILSFTCLVLIAFFISVGVYKNWRESIGLSLMIAMLLLRVIVELISKSHLQNIEQTLDFQSYVSKLNHYFKNRRWIHLLLTPLIYVVYFGGFISMFPVFKAQLSEGFYHYILISGGVVFMGLGLFIGYHIRKELKDLLFLKRVLES